MKQNAENDDWRDDDPDLLENSGLSKLFISRLRNVSFIRLSDFDGMSDADILREPGVNGRILRAIRAEQARRASS